MIYFQGNIRVSLNHYSTAISICGSYSNFMQPRRRRRSMLDSFWDPCNLPVGLLSTFTSYISLGSPHGCVCTVWQCNQSRKEIKYPGGTKHRAQMIHCNLRIHLHQLLHLHLHLLLLYLMLQFTLNLARCTLQANFTLFITSFVVIIQVQFLSVFLYFLESFWAQGNIQQKLNASFGGLLIDFYHSVVDSFCMQWFCKTFWL